MKDNEGKIGGIKRSEENGDVEQSHKSFFRQPLTHMLPGEYQGHQSGRLVEKIHDTSKDSLIPSHAQGKNRHVFFLGGNFAYFGICGAHHAQTQAGAALFTTRGLFDG